MEGGEVISPRPVFSKCTPSVVRRGSPVKVTLNFDRRTRCSAGEQSSMLYFYVSLFNILFIMVDPDNEKKKAKIENISVH